MGYGWHRGNVNAGVKTGGAKYTCFDSADCRRWHSPKNNSSGVEKDLYKDEQICLIYDLEGCA